MQAAVKIFFQLVSIFAHPILLPLYFSLAINSAYELSIWAVFLHLILIPTSLILLVLTLKERNELKQQKKKYMQLDELGNFQFLQDIELEEQRKGAQGIFANIENLFSSTVNRTLSLLILALTAGLCYSFYPRYEEVFSLLMLLTIIASISCMVINNFWRLSLHAYGWGFATYLTIFQYAYMFKHPILGMSLVLIMSGLVLSGRLFLGKHSVRQVYFGYLLGQLIPAAFYFAIFYK